MTLRPMDQDKLQLLRRGVAIPASPLALDRNRKFDERRQRLLFRYYAEAGAGGVAVGVHTTQFEIRDPQHGLLEPVLRLGAETIDQLSRELKRPIIRIAGVCGQTAQAVKEAETAAALGYDAGLLSLGALRNATEDEMITHCRAVSEIIPLVGFYLQPAAGGRILPYGFWRRFAEIQNVVAIKMAPFNRYQTIDVVRAVAEAGRDADITLYTGNDDNIIMDLLTPYVIRTQSGEKTLRIRGGLLGQWSVWTKTSVEMLNQIHEIAAGDSDVTQKWLTKNIELTDANAVVFDAANAFAGCIAGIHEVLRRQGLLETIHCLNPNEVLSAGQADELDRIARSYPWLNDDEFVAAHLDEWLKKS